MYHHRETIKSNIQIMMIQRKGFSDSHMVRAKGNLKLSYGGPSLRQASGTNRRIKALGHFDIVVMTNQCIFNGIVLTKMHSNEAILFSYKQVQ